jgi:hypothetical protein
MQRFHVLHSSEGFEVELVEVSWWLEALCLALEYLDVASGHRLCRIWLRAVYFEDHFARVLHRFVVDSTVARALGAIEEDE